MAKLSRTDALTFYKRFYAPNNAILVVTGDVTPDEVRKLATATYGADSPQSRRDGAGAAVGAAAARRAARRAQGSARRAAHLAAATTSRRPTPRPRRARRKPSICS